MTYFIALVSSICLSVVGQISLKAGALQSKANDGFLYFQKFTLVGLFIYFSAALLYIYALKRIPVSVASPSVSISYIVVAYLAHVIWGEAFGVRQIQALLLIGAGMFLLSSD